MWTFQKCMFSQYFILVSFFHSVSGISGSQQFSLHGFPFPTSTALNLQVAPMMAFQQINHVADGKQQLHSTIGAQDHAMEQKK